MERCRAPPSVSSCIAARPSRVCRMRVAMLVTSLLAGTYVFVALLRHGRRRTVLASRDHSHDDDVTAGTPPTIGGYWLSRKHDVDSDFAATTFDGITPLFISDRDRSL